MANIEIFIEIETTLEFFGPRRKVLVTMCLAPLRNQTAQRNRKKKKQRSHRTYWLFPNSVSGWKVIVHSFRWTPGTRTNEFSFCGMMLCYFKYTFFLIHRLSCFFSRQYGPIHSSHIRGRLVFRLWPWNRDDLRDDEDHLYLSSCSVSNQRPIPYSSIDAYVGNRFGLYRIEANSNE